jgi:hypothetical protein
MRRYTASNSWRSLELELGAPCASGNGETLVVMVTATQVLHYTPQLVLKKTCRVSCRSLRG